MIHTRIYVYIYFLGGGSRNVGKRDLDLLVSSKLKKKINKKTRERAFPGGPVVGTPCLQGRGHGFNPWSGNQDPTRHVVWPK